MSRLTKAVTTTLAPNYEAPNYEQPYLPQHPMLQYKVAHQEKEDHLVNYQEVQQYPAENMFGDMIRKAGTKLQGMVVNVKKKMQQKAEVKKAEVKKAKEKKAEEAKKKAEEQEAEEAKEREAKEKEAEEAKEEKR